MEKRLFLLVFVAFLAACEKMNESLVASQVRARVEKYRSEREAEHRQKLLDLASKNVDSLLLNEARQKLLDSLHQTRPFRPVAPPPIPALDSGKAKPLF